MIIYASPLINPWIGQYENNYDEGNDSAGLCVKGAHRGAMEALLLYVR